MLRRQKAGQCHSVRFAQSAILVWCIAEGGSVRSLGSFPQHTKCCANVSIPLGFHKCFLRGFSSFLGDELFALLANDASVPSNVSYVLSRVRFQLPRYVFIWGDLRTCQRKGFIGYVLPHSQLGLLTDTRRVYCLTHSMMVLLFKSSQEIFFHQQLDVVRKLKPCQHA